MVGQKTDHAVCVVMLAEFTSISPLRRFECYDDSEQVIVNSGVLNNKKFICFVCIHRNSWNSVSIETKCYVHERTRYCCRSVSGVKFRSEKEATSMSSEVTS